MAEALEVTNPIAITKSVALITFVPPLYRLYFWILLQQAFAESLPSSMATDLTDRPNVAGA
jgi:hypothetical protein